MGTGVLRGQHVIGACGVTMVAAYLERAEIAPHFQRLRFEGRQHNLY